LSQRSLLLHAKGQSHRAPARRDSNRLRLHHTHPGRAHLHRRKGQRTNSSAEVPTSKRGRRGNNDVTRRASVKRLDELRPDLASAIKDSSLSRRKRARNGGRAWQETVREGSRPIPIKYEEDSFERRPRSHSAGLRSRAAR